MALFIQPPAKTDLSALQAKESDIEECFTSQSSPFPKFSHGLGPAVPDWYWFIGNNYVFKKFKIIFSLDNGNTYVWQISVPTQRDFSKYRNWTGL
jgi:hypothetical protein